MFGIEGRILGRLLSSLHLFLECGKTRRRKLLEPIP
jgi:hypothetical protein